MMETFTKEQANVLTTSGFHKHFNALLPTTKTRYEAYDSTEHLHEQVHEQGLRKYASFDSFDQYIRRIDKKSRPS